MYLNFTSFPSFAYKVVATFKYEVLLLFKLTKVPQQLNITN